MRSSPTGIDCLDILPSRSAGSPYTKRARQMRRAQGVRRSATDHECRPGRDYLPLSIMPMNVRSAPQW